MGTKHPDTEKPKVFAGGNKKFQMFLSKITENYILGNRLIFRPINSQVPFFHPMVGSQSAS